MQGEDVVAGIRTPQDIDTMRQALPDAYKELLENCDILEAHYKEMMVRSLTRLHRGCLWIWYLILRITSLLVPNINQKKV